LRPYHKENFDLKDVSEFEDMSDLIYKSELLYVIGLTDINELNSSSHIFDIYNIVKEEFTNVIKKMKVKHFCKNDETAFIILFSYDYFFATHRCLCDFFEKGKFMEENIELLHNLIK